jgi:hypothetical protein
MAKVIYERSFDANEWFVITSLILLGVLVWITPKRFTFLEGTAYLLFGVCFGMFFDHTISVKPWDYYDVNDSSAYQLMDFLSYVMYGPFGYFFLYFYEKLRISGYTNVLYLAGWVMVAMLLEYIGLIIGLFHFDKGYKMYWSIPIYLFMISLLILYYHCVKYKLKQRRGKSV